MPAVGRAACQETRDLRGSRGGQTFCKKPDSTYFWLCGSHRFLLHVLYFHNPFKM